MASSSTSLPSLFESHGGHLEEFDDGHCPETFRFQVDEEKHTQNDDGNLADEDRAIGTPRIVRYSSGEPSPPASSRPTSPSSVHVYDGVLGPNHARMLYRATAPGKHGRQTKNDAPIGLEGESPWGTYVTIKEAVEWIEWNKSEGNSECDHGDFVGYLAHWRQRMIRYCKRQQQSERQSSEEKKEEQMKSDADENYVLNDRLDDMDDIRHLLAVEAVAKFFLETIPSRPGTTEVATAHSGQSSKDEALFDTAQFLKKAHGVAVWALASGPGHSVSYHIDYAELLRYEYNVTVPPLWAGTIQCSSLWNDRGCSSDAQCERRESHSDRNCMKGGEFCVNLRGLDHYAENGYKGSLSGDSAGGWSRPSHATAGRYLKGGLHINDDDQWVTIPYAFNRGIVHHGEFPHLSAPIESIGSYDKTSLLDDGEHASRPSRVIVGFNVFSHDVGSLIAKAPEHSKPFRRKVSLYRSTMNASTNNGKDGVDGKSSRSGIDLSRIRKNKGLTKLLVLAKRERVKEELRQNQEQLTRRIWSQMFNHCGRRPLSVSDVVEKAGCDNDKLIDVHVHLHHMLLSKKSAQDVGQQRHGGIHNTFQDRDGVAGPPGTWYCLNAVKNDEEIPSKGGLIPLSTLLEIVECKQ